MKELTSMSRSYYGAVVIGLFLGTFAPAGARASTVELGFRLEEIRSYPLRGDSTAAVYVLKFDLPPELAGKYIEFAQIEFYVNATLKGNAVGTTSAVVAVFPLVENFDGANIPRFDFTRAVRNVNLGEARRVVLDISDIVRQWVDGSRMNHGLIIGGLAGAKRGQFNLRKDKLPEARAARVRIHYRDPAK